MSNLFRVSHIDTRMTSINVLLVSLLLPFILSLSCYLFTFLSLHFCSGVFIAIFKQISRLELFLLLSALNMTVFLSLSKQNIKRILL